MNVLSLVQTSPSSNPDRMLLKCVVSGDYTQGTPDPLPLSNISDPSGMGVIPNSGSGTNPPAVTPSVFNAATQGYRAEVWRVVANGLTSFGLRWFSGGNELASGAFPAQIAGAEIFIEVLANLPAQS